MGRLCQPYGAIVIAMAFIPNPVLGRLAFVFCGATVFIIGCLLVRHSRARPTSS